MDAQQNKVAVTFSDGQRHGLGAADCRCMVHLPWRLVCRAMLHRCTEPSVVLPAAAQPANTAGSDALLLLYISLLGSAASYGVFFYNASRGSLTALSSLTFLTPCFAAAGGYLALGETLTPLQLAGAGVTLGAVALINNSHKGDGQDSGSGGGGGGEAAAAGKAE